MADDSQFNGWKVEGMDDRGHGPFVYEFDPKRCFERLEPPDWKRRVRPFLEDHFYLKETQDSDLYALQKYRGGQPGTVKTVVEALSGVRGYMTKEAWHNWSKFDVGFPNGGKYSAAKDRGVKQTRMDLMTRTTAVTPLQWNTPGSRLVQFLESSVPGKRNRLQLQTACGYFLMRHNPNQVAVWFVGPPAAGKSSFADAIAMALGGYKATLSVDHLPKRGSNDFSFTSKMAEVAEARMVLITGEAKNREMDIGRYTSMTGDDHDDSRRIGQDTRSHSEVGYTMLFTANSLPFVPYHDPAVIRRTIVIPFDCQVHRTQDMADWLKSFEGQRMILDWMLEGYRMVLKKKGRRLPPLSKKQKKLREFPVREFRGVGSNAARDDQRMNNRLDLSSRIQRVLVKKEGSKVEIQNSEFSKWLGPVLKEYKKSNSPKGIGLALKAAGIKTKQIRKGKERVRVILGYALKLDRDI